MEAKTKTTVKAEEKKVEVKATPVAEEKKATAKTATKTAAKKTAAKTEKKTTAKKTTKSETATDKKTNLFIQYQGKEFNSEVILEKVKEAITAETGKKTFKTLDIYVKPEESVAYYVVNGKPGSVRL